ncbi:MAG: serine/threonine protein kinase [Myxococcales bacterium]|nr:MAG: serine/threonine protein kinase [Myxococcales bacterium]
MPDCMTHPVGPGGTMLYCAPGSGSPDSERHHAARSLPVVGDVVGGRYRLLSALGEGQFGRVYRAERTDLPAHHVALKVLDVHVYAGRDPETELRLLSAVAHPHIVQLADHGVGRGHVWFTMPLYAGRSLAEAMTGGVLTPRQARDVFAPIVDGLDVLHGVGLRHQDIKPDNVFLASFAGSVSPILLDLGAAAPARAPHPAAGTLLYAAPEQRRALLACVRGELHGEQLDESVDVYGLAATLLHALVGDELFPGSEALDLADLDEAARCLERAAVERATAPLRPGSLPGLPAAARDEIGRALVSWLAIDPARRPTMAQLRRELDVLLAGEAWQQRRRQLRRAALGALGAATIAAGVAAAVGLTEARQHGRRMQHCTDALVTTQQQAQENVTDLGQCQRLLASAHHESQECGARLTRQQAAADEQQRLATDAAAASWQTRLDRCEGERRATVATCNADIEALVREQTALSMERDMLRGERRAHLAPAGSAAGPKRQAKR